MKKSPLSIRLSLIAALAVALFAAAPAGAIEGEPPQVVVTWIGGEGSWHDPANWSPAVVPNNTETETYAVEILAAGSKVTTDAVEELSIDKLTVGEDVEVNIQANYFIIMKNGILNNDGIINLNGNQYIEFLENMELQGSGSINTYYTMDIFFKGNELINGSNHTLNITGSELYDNDLNGLFINNNKINTSYLYIYTKMENNGTIELKGEDSGAQIDAKYKGLINNGKIEINNKGRIECEIGLGENAKYIEGGEISLNGNEVLIGGNFKDVHFTGNAANFSYSTETHLIGNCVFDGNFVFDIIFFSEMHIYDGFVFNGTGSIKNTTIAAHGNFTIGENFVLDNVNVLDNRNENIIILENNGILKNMAEFDVDIINNNTIEYNQESLGSGPGLRFNNIYNENGLIQINVNNLNEYGLITPLIISGNLNINGNIGAISTKLKNVTISGEAYIKECEINIFNSIINNGKFTSNILNINSEEQTAFVEGSGEWSIVGDKLQLGPTLFRGNNLVLVNGNNHKFLLQDCFSVEAEHTDFINKGIFDIDNIGSAYFNSITNENIFKLNWGTTGSHFIANNWLQYQGTIILSNGDHLNGYLQGSDFDFNLNGGSLIGSQYMHFLRINNAGGSISPGFENEAGAFIFENGNYSQSVDGFLNMDILLGPNGFLQADQLRAATVDSSSEERATLGGTLNVYVAPLAGSPEPVTIKLLEFDSIEGAFDQVNIFNESPYINIDFGQTDREVTIQVTSLAQPRFPRFGRLGRSVTLSGGFLSAACP
jgi:hypothetical protein